MLAVSGEKGLQVIEFGQQKMVAGVAATGFQVLLNEPESTAGLGSLVLWPHRVIVKVWDQVDGCAFFGHMQVPEVIVRQRKRIRSLKRASTFWLWSSPPGMLALM